MKEQNTKIAACTCDHKAQDQKYGAGNRVFNRLQGQKKRGWRCTVCKRELLG